MQPISSNFPDAFGVEALAAWQSAEYFAALFPQSSAFRLSIARVGGSDTPLSWEELMQVKRDCGFGAYDALEVYPRDEDIFNTGNIRHLYLGVPVEFALRKNTHVLPPSNTGE